MNEKFKIWLEKEKRNLIKGSFIGFITSILLTTTVLLIFLSVPFINQGTIIDFGVKNSFEKISNSWEDNFVTASLGGLCFLNEDDYGRIKCVYDFLVSNSEYGYNSKAKEWTNSLIGGPEYFFNTSIVCRDAAVMACAVYSNMGYDCSIEIEPNHAFAKVYTTYYDYKVDIAKYKFEELGK